MSGSIDLVFYRLVIGRVAADRGKTYCWRLTPLVKCYEGALTDT